MVVPSRDAPAPPGRDQAAGRPAWDHRAETDRRLGRGLAGYLSAVADSLDVEVEATSSEVTDTATAYLALAVRTAEYPGRDLMLVWSERSGWRLAVETDPAEDTVVLAYLGADPVPEPAAVVRFVHDVLNGVATSANAGQATAAPPVPPGPAERSAADRAVLGRRLARYAIP